MENTFSKILMPILILFAGSSIASFIMCMIDRRDVKDCSKRSICDSCHHTLGFFDLVPILSYLFLQGKCRYCKEEINHNYVVGEIIFGSLAVVEYIVFSLSYNFIVIFLITIILFAISYYDFCTFLIPNTGLLLIVLIWLTQQVILKKQFILLIEEVVYACVIPLMLFGFILYFEKKKCISMMGLGDLKLLFACGLYLNWPFHVVHLFISSLIGLAFAGLLRMKKIPFGPCISIGFIFVALSYCCF